MRNSPPDPLKYGLTPLREGHPLYARCYAWPLFVLTARFTVFSATKPQPQTEYSLSRGLSIFLAICIVKYCLDHMTTRRSRRVTSTRDHFKPILRWTTRKSHINLFVSHFGRQLINSLVGCFILGWSSLPRLLNRLRDRWKIC